MATAARLLVSIDANSAKLVTEMGKARKATESMKSSLESMKSSLSTIQASSIVYLATAALNATERIYTFGKTIATTLNDIQRQSEILGITTDQFQKFSYVAKMADVDIQTFMTGMKLLSNNMEAAAKGTGDAVETFKMLGVAVKGSDQSYRQIEDVLMDLMDAFSKYEDGAGKIAAANNLFGKSGYLLIPFLNKGRAGFAALTAEAERLGIILDPSLIKAGSKAEDVFKRLEAQFTATKLSFAPMVKDITYGVEDILASFNKLDKWLKENKTKDWFPWLEEVNQWLKKNTIKAWKIDLGITKPDFSKSYESWSGQYRKEKMPEFSKGDDKEKEAAHKRWLEQLGREAEIYERINGLVGENAAFWVENKKRLDIQAESLEKINAIEGDVAQTMADDMFPSIDKVNRIVEQGNKYFEEQRVKLIEIQNLVKDFGWEDYAAGLDAASDATRELTQASQKVYKMSDDLSTLKSIGDSFASTLTSSMTMLMSSTDDWGEKFKKAGESVLQTIMQIIAQTLIMNALFGNTKGEKITGGLLGGIGSILGIKMAEGGIVSRPTMLLAGEAGPEAIIPLDEGGGMGGNTYIMINAMDPKSMFDSLTQNPEGILTIMGKSNRTKGIASKLGR